MLTLKLLGRVINALNDGALPWQIALGFVLGFIMGLIPGWPIQVFLLLFLIFIVNVNISIAGVGAVIASLGAWILDPLVDRVGVWVLRDIGALQGVWTALYNYPPMVLTRFNNSVVMGAMVVGVIGGAIWYPILIWLVKVYRQRFLAWVQKLWITKLVTGSKVFGFYQRVTSLGFSE